MRDKDLITFFLKGYNRFKGCSYEVEEWPDQIERKKRAVDAAARDRNGKVLAVEHTVLQPFPDDIKDGRAFLACFGALENDSSLEISGYELGVFADPYSIPKGEVWADVACKLREWLRATKESLPDGESEHDVPNLGFGLKLTVVKEQCPDTPAYVWVARRLPPRGLENEMRRVLSEKLPKLIDTPSNERVLLLENRSLGSNHHAVANAIEAISSDYPELQKLDAAWLVTTTFSRPYFRRVWPGGLGEKFIDP